MQRPESLTKDTLIYMSGSIIAKLASFAMTPVYTYFLTPEDYGILGYVSTINALLSTILTLGLEGAVLRLYFDFKQDSQELRDFMGTLYLSVGAFAVLVLVIFEGVGSWQPFAFSSAISYSPYIRLGVLISVFSIVPSLTLNYYRAQRKAVRYVTLSLAGFFLSTAAVVYLVAIRTRGALGSLEGSLIAATVLNLIYAFDLRKNINLTIVRRNLRVALKYSFPLVPGSIAGWGMLSSGRLFIGEYSSLHELGLYNLAFALSMVLLLAVTGFTSAWYPFFLRP